MKTYETLENQERVIDEPNSEASDALASLQAREPKRALTLSIVPGLGQLYNGESGKGLLFLGVTGANLLLVALLFYTGPVLHALVQLAAVCFHTAPKIDIQHAIEVAQGGRSVTYTYLALIGSYALYTARDAYDRAREKRMGKELPKFKFTMPEATSGSYLFHISIICSLILMILLFAAPPKTHTQVTNIAIEIPDKPKEPTKKTEPPKAKVQPKQEPKLAPPKVEKPEKVEPPKPTPVAVAVPTKTAIADPVVQSNEPVKESAPAPQESGSTSGSPSGTGQESAAAGGDGDDVDFDDYMAEVQKRIKKNWHPPRNTESQTITVKFDINPDGTLGAIKLVKIPDMAAAVDAAKLAISASAPFPPLPKGAGGPVTIKFTFDYAVFSGKASSLTQQ